MATVIDALVVSLGLDASKFRQGAKQTSQDLKKVSEDAARAAADMEARGKQAAQFFSKLRNEAIALVAIFTAGMGLKNFTVNAINGAASLGRMSDNLEITTERLTAWQRVARDAGGTAEGMTAQLKESQQALAMANRGILPEGAQEFYRQGGNSLQSYKTAEEYLAARIAIVERLNKTKGPGAAQLAAAQMGLDPANFNLYKQGNEAIARLIAAKQKLSPWTKEEAAQAIIVKNKWDQIGDTYDKVSNKVLFALMPSIDKLLNVFERLGKWFLDHKDEIDTWIEKAVSKITEFAEWADKAAKAVGGWENVLLALAAIKIMSMVAPLLSLAGALMKVGVAMGVVAGTGTGAVAALSGIGLIAAGVAMATYSEDLNSGETATLDALRNAQGADNSNGVSAVDKLMALGWKRHEAIGIVGALQGESGIGLDPKAVGDNGSAVGIAQWHPDRQANIKKRFGKDVRDLTRDEQIQAVDWELRNTERAAGDAIRATTNNQAAARAATLSFLRPNKKDDDKNVATRQGYAAALFGATGGLSGSEQALGSVNTVGAAAGNRGPASGTVNNNSTQVSVGKVEVHTPATTVDGIGDAITESLKKLTNASQANTGLQ